jgi:hypothetical protein
MSPRIVAPVLPGEPARFLLRSCMQVPGRRGVQCTAGSRGLRFYGSVYCTLSDSQVDIRPEQVEYSGRMTTRNQPGWN